LPKDAGFIGVARAGSRGRQAAAPHPRMLMKISIQWLFRVACLPKDAGDWRSPVHLDAEWAAVRKSAESHAPACWWKSASS